MAGSTYSAPTKITRSAVDTHSPSRLLRALEQSDTRLVSARGITFAADGMIHADATELLHTKTPSHVMDAGLRDALGRSACALQNLVSVETPATCERLHLILTGTSARSPLKCLLCGTDAVDDGAFPIGTAPWRRRLSAHMSKVSLKQALAARRLFINPGVQCTKMCWPSCGSDSRTLHTVEGSWCAGLARFRLPIRLIDVATHTPLPAVDPRWMMTQGRLHQARVPAQLGRALGHPPDRNPRSTTRKHAFERVSETSSRDASKLAG